MFTALLALIETERNMFTYSFADIQAQLDALPTLYRVWFAWLGLIVVILPFVFLKHRQGRVAMLFALAFIPLLLVVVHSTGITYVISFLHVALWLPLLWYLARELRAERVNILSPFGLWMNVAVATLIISLVFDVRDAIRWAAGERAILDPEPGIVMPWVTIPAMLTALAIAGWSILGPRLRHKKK